MTDNRNLKEGIHDGFLIGLGYFAVAFSLGFVAQKAGLTPLQGFLASFLNHASAGENGLYTSVVTLATYAEVAIITLIANARYLLMSCSLSQRFDPKAPFFHRLIVGFCITDEFFGVSIARPGYLSTRHYYSCALLAIFMWSTGTFMGIWLGNLLPPSVVSALSVSLYGMFIAIIIPPSKKDKVVAIAVVASFLLSYLCTITPLTQGLSSGTRTIILTILIATVAAIVKPINEEVNQ